MDFQKKSIFYFRKSLPREEMIRLLSYSFAFNSKFLYLYKYTPTAMRKILINFQFCILAILLFHSTSFAQNPNLAIGKVYARSIVDTLASPYMGGRGYVDEGNKRAADYLTSQFKNIGLLPFGDSYEQKFEYPVNTYPTAYIVSVNGDVAEPGADYIIIPSTPVMKGNYPVVKLDRSILTDSNKLKNFFAHDYSQTFILMDDSGVTDKKEKELWQSIETSPTEGGSNPFKARGVIVLCDKLT